LIVNTASPSLRARASASPLMAPALVAIGTYALLLARNEYLYRFLLLSDKLAHDSARGSRAIPQQRCWRTVVGGE